MCTFWRAMRFSVCTVCLVCSGCGKLWGRWRRSTSLSKQRNMWSSCRSSGALNWLWTAVRQTPHHVSVCTAAVITHCAFTFCSPAHTCIPPSAVQTKQLKQWRALTLITKWWLKKCISLCMHILRALSSSNADTVESITPDKVRSLRDLLNSSAMDIMYYTSPLYRDEVTHIHDQ